MNWLNQLLGPIDRKLDLILEKLDESRQREEFTINKLLEIEQQLNSLPIHVCPELPTQPNFDPYFWKGNFLCFPNYPNAHMYPGWNTEARKTFRTLYAKAGHTHLPVSIYGSYGGVTYDYTDNLSEFRKILEELKSSSIEPCLFVVTDAVNDKTRITPANAQRFCDATLPRLRDLIKLACLGWELNQVDGWGTDRSGHDMIDLSKHIRWNLPTAEIALHLQPNWWGPHYADGDEWDFWRDAGEINTLLFQIRPDSSTDINGDPSAPDGLYLALRYPHGSGVFGVAGRIVSLSKKFVMFEHSKDNLTRWEQVRNIVQADSRVRGWC